MPLRDWFVSLSANRQALTSCISFEFYRCSPTDRSLYPASHSDYRCQSTSRMTSAFLLPLYLTRTRNLTPPTIEIVGFLGGGGKAHHHAAYQAASYAVSHKKPRAWLSVSIQPLQVDQHTCLYSQLFECILLWSFTSCEAALSRGTCRDPRKTIIFRTQRLLEDSFQLPAGAFLYFHASLKTQEKQL